MVQRQYDRYLKLKFDVNWRWGKNPASIRAFRKAPPKLNETQQRVVDELNATGVSMCHIDKLFEDRGLWSELSNEVCAFSSSDEVQSVIRKRQQDFAQTQALTAAQHYIITKYSQDRKPLITSSDILLRFGVNPLVLDVANSYLGLWS